MSQIPRITCAMSSLCFPWLSNNEKMLSNKVYKMFLFSCHKNQQLQSISPMSSKQMDACLSLSSKWICLSFCLCFCDFEKSCLPLKMQGLSKCFFQGDKFACLPPQHWRRRVPRKSQLLFAKQKGSVLFRAFSFFNPSQY